MNATESLHILRKFRRETLRPWWFDWEWPVIGAAALLALVLGIVGFRLQLAASGKPVEAVDLVFRAFQLFVLQISVDPPMPWQLNVARVLAPLVAGYTAIQALSQLLADQFQSLRLRFLRKHVVICGLGRKGLILAREYASRGQLVVVIEEDADNDFISQCRDMGGIVLSGDASDTLMLRKARVGRATHLFALTGNDGVNAEIAIRTKSLMPDDREEPLDCALHVFDARLCDLLHERELAPGFSRQISMVFFNTFDLGARVLLEEHPLCDEGDDPKTSTGRLVIVGVGWLGESLLATAARQWHAAGHAPEARMKATLIDQNARDIAAKMVLRYPGLPRICDLEALDMDVRSSSFQQADFLAPGRPGGPPARVFVCMDDDSLNLSAALALAAKGHAHEPRIVVRMARDAGLAVLLKDVGSLDGSFHHLRAFCLLDRICKPDTVLYGTREIVARAIHEEYVRKLTEDGVDPLKNKAMVPWKDLPEDLKQANRGQAKDIWSKLADIGCSISPLLDWDEPLFEFADGEVEGLARKEHDRWMAERTRAGWVYGEPRDDTKKRHPSLVAYGKLSAEEQEKDLNAVLRIPALLAGVGLRVHRLPGK